MKGRRDLRRVATVTIAAAVSKDLDDALAVLPVAQLDGLGVTGTVATEALGPGPWELDKATYSLVSKRRSYMVGEAVRVRVASTDEALGRIELELRPSQ